MINERYISAGVMRLIVVLFVSLLLVGARAGVTDSDTSSVSFRVSGFRVLPNDVSAFITPVRDLNNEACALVKVVASPDFAFSSPLGIVKRKDEVGEIWLYLPNGTRLLTLKHPRWGVMRDYRFPKPLESRMAYELTIEEPREPVVTERDTVVVTKTVVDTVGVERRRPRLPWSGNVLATVSFNGHRQSWGLMVAAMRRHGFYVHGVTGMNRIGKTVATCDADGYVDDSGIKPYYTGKERYCDFTVTAGAVHRLFGSLCLFEGIGYGRSATAWQLADSEGGGYALNKDLTHKGIAGEAGLMVSWGPVSLLASVITIKGSRWQGCVGIGIRLR